MVFGFGAPWPGWDVSLGSEVPQLGAELGVGIWLGLGLEGMGNKNKTPVVARS